MFDYDVKITSFVSGQYLEINLDGKPVYKGEFPHYAAAAAFADHFLNDEYVKFKEKNSKCLED